MPEGGLFLVISSECAVLGWACASPWGAGAAALEFITTAAIQRQEKATVLSVCASKRRATNHIVSDS